MGGVAAVLPERTLAALEVQLQNKTCNEIINRRNCIHNQIVISTEIVNYFPVSTGMVNDWHVNMKPCL